MISVTKLYSALFNNLSPRQKEVISGRFGLDKSSKPQTLAALGNRYGVTRERIRQIETSALHVFKKEIAAHADFQEIVGASKRFLKESGGVAPKTALLEYLMTFVDGITENHVALIIEASKAFYAHPDDKNFRPFYYLDKQALKNLSGFISQWASLLHSKKQEVLRGKYDEHLVAFLKKKGVDASHADVYLSVSKRIHQSAFGDKGLTDWPEIRPKTIRDRAYLILKKKAKPLHFRDITEVINKAGFEARTASAPTVHNELIKDPRFVLVGRGIYALAEYGFEPGTAREIIQKVLGKQGSMKPRDIVLAIQKERFFKPNTILVNLQNKSFFERLPNGNYQIRES